MDKTYLYIGQPGINDVAKIFFQEESIIFPNLAVSQVGKYFVNYFSFEGFYEIKDFSKNIMNLKKLNCLKPADVPLEYSVLNLEFSNTLALQKSSEGGSSFVKGKVFSENLEGTIRKIRKKNYEILISKKSFCI